MSSGDRKDGKGARLRNTVPVHLQLHSKTSKQSSSLSLSTSRADEHANRRPTPIGAFCAACAAIAAIAALCSTAHADCHVPMTGDGVCSAARSELSESHRANTPRASASEALLALAGPTWHFRGSISPGRACTKAERVVCGLGSQERICGEGV